MMPSGLRGLPQFLRFAGTYPQPRPLMTALQHGPLGTLGAGAGTLYQLRDGRELVALASFGHTRVEAERYAVLPLSLDLAVCHAARTGEAVISDAEGFGTRNLAAIDADLLDSIFARVDASIVVCTPVVHDGVVVGALAFTASKGWDDDAANLLDAIAGVLALWMTNPSTGLDPEPSSVQRGLSPTLTERQAEILRRVDAGVPTGRIAIDLRVSTSTVKADLQNAMKVLRTSDRAEAVTRARALGLL